MESVFDYSDSTQDEKKEMEEQTEIVQNGFGPEGQDGEKQSGGEVENKEEVKMKKRKKTAEHNFPFLFLL